MRAKTTEKNFAIFLREQGLSYSEIQAHVPVSQASLSLWLKDIQLSPAQNERLAVRKLLGAREGANKVHKEKLERIERIVHEADREAVRMLASGDQLWLAGTVLYWAEGAKTKPWNSPEIVCLTKMDPNVIRTFVHWLRRYCGITPFNLNFSLYIHPNGDVRRARTYWANELSLDESILRIYFKRPSHAPGEKIPGGATM
ncbi:MAG: hypothetical protein ACREP8_02290, partial [Candidatus Binatia bacterium]